MAIKLPTPPLVELNVIEGGCKVKVASAGLPGLVDADMVWLPGGKYGTVKVVVKSPSLVLIPLATGKLSKVAVIAASGAKPVPVMAIKFPTPPLAGLNMIEGVGIGVGVGVGTAV
jgi:hypothetical protein